MLSVPACVSLSYHNKPSFDNSHTARSLEKVDDPCERVVNSIYSWQNIAKALVGLSDGSRGECSKEKLGLRQGKVYLTLKSRA